MGSEPLFGKEFDHTCRTAQEQIEWNPGELIYKNRSVIACDALTPWWEKKVEGDNWLKQTDQDHESVIDKRKTYQQPFVVTIDKELKEQSWECRYNKFHMLAEPLFAYRHSYGATHWLVKQAGMRHYHIILMKASGPETCAARVRIDLTQTTKNIDGLIGSNRTDLYAENALKIIINFSPLDIISPPEKDTKKQ